MTQQRNRLLRALDQPDWEALRPHLEEVHLPRGRLICEDGHRFDYAYFPHDCVISILAVLKDGTTPEMATIGPEGVVGVVPMLGSREAFGRYLVQVPGRASRIHFDNLQAAMADRPRCRQVILRYVQALVAQTFQTVACNASHPVEARCSRWILTIHDRLGGGPLPLTHEFLAAMLAVQRPTVSIVTRTLQTAGLIKQQRGAITVVDPAGLEEAACECYRHIRRRFDTLFPLIGAEPVAEIAEAE